MYGLPCVGITYLCTAIDAEQWILLQYFLMVLFLLLLLSRFCVSLVQLFMYATDATLCTRSHRVTVDNIIVNRGNGLFFFFRLVYQSWKKKMVSSRETVSWIVINVVLKCDQVLKYNSLSYYLLLHSTQHTAMTRFILFFSLSGWKIKNVCVNVVV